MINKASKSNPEEKTDREGIEKYEVIIDDDYSLKISKQAIKFRKKIFDRVFRLLIVYFLLTARVTMAARFAWTNCE